MVYKYSENIPFKAGAWILVIIAIPGVSGAAMGICNQRDYFRKALHHAGLTPAHSIPSAWDYKFSRARGEWLLVTLKNGTQFAGWWAGQSFASDERSERDLLIEQVFDIADSGPWTPTPRSVSRLRPGMARLHPRPGSRHAGGCWGRSERANSGFMQRSKI